MVFMLSRYGYVFFFFFKQKTAYEMRISDWSSDVCSSDLFGNPVTVKNGICIHEEDFGVVWKHFDPFTRVSDVRRQRRLVVSTFLTAGNYDYGFFWYFYLDGKIELEVKANGLVVTSGYRARSDEHTSELQSLMRLSYSVFCLKTKNKKRLLI